MVPDLNYKMLDLTLQVSDLKTEVPDLGSGDIRLNLRLLSPATHSSSVDTMRDVSAETS